MVIGLILYLPAVSLPLRGGSGIAAGWQWGGSGIAAGWQWGGDG